MDENSPKLTAANDGGKVAIDQRENNDSQNPVQELALDFLSSSTAKANNSGGTIVGSWEKKWFECEVCGKSFKHLSKFKRHKNTHTGEKPFECEVCSKGFSSCYDLKIHGRTHTGEKPCGCQVCDKSFKCASDLKKHSRIHQGVKPFLCDVCAKSFINLFDLKIHARTHTGEKPFPCELCGKGFKSSSDLKKHKKIHTGEKPFQCEMCHKRFGSSSELSNHQPTHTEDKPFRCALCNRTFKHSSTLRIHHRIHTGEKPFRCKVCAKSFTCSSSLSKHSKIHYSKDNNMFPCKVCGKSFSQSINLNKHVRAAHHTAAPQESFGSHSPNLNKHKKIISSKKRARKIFECGVCGATFTRLSVFEAHVQGHESSSILPDDGYCDDTTSGIGNDVESERTQVYHFPPVEAIYLKIEQPSDSEENMDSSGQDDVDDKWQVARELMSNMMEELTPTQRQICLICLEDKSDCGIKFADLISRLRECFVLESHGYLENTVMQMTQSSLAGSNDLTLLIFNDEQSELTRSELSDETSRFQNASIKLHPLASSILEKIQAQV